MIPISDSIKSRSFPLINVGLILLTIYAFFLQITALNPEGFIMQYALVPANVNLSDYTTWIPFITSIFLHGGILHIASNMLFLWVFGDNVEGFLGKIQYLFLYLASGIVGGFTQYILMSDSAIPMLGASGAVAGSLGAYFVLLPHSRIKTLVPFFGFLTFVNIPARFMLGYWIVLQVLSGAVTIPGGSETGGVAFFAHIGGFFTGYLLAKILHPNPVYLQNEV